MTHWDGRRRPASDRDESERACGGNRTGRAGSVEMDPIPEPRRAFEYRRRDEFLSQDGAVCEDYALRGDVVDVGGALHERKSFLFGDRQHERQRSCRIPSSLLPCNDTVSNVTEAIRRKIGCAGSPANQCFVRIRHPTSSDETRATGRRSIRQEDASAVLSHRDRPAPRESPQDRLRCGPVPRRSQPGRASCRATRHEPTRRHSSSNALQKGGRVA